MTSKSSYWRHAQESSYTPSCKTTFPSPDRVHGNPSNYPKIWTMWFNRWVMCPKDAQGIANSVDPDWTAPADLGLHCLPRPLCPNMSRLITKPTKSPLCPTKTQISPVWSEPLLSAWRNIGPLPTECRGKTLIRLGECPGWSESLLCAQYILLGLLCGGSYSEASGYLTVYRCKARW